MKHGEPWSRADKIGFGSLAVGVLGVVAALLFPEVRVWLHLEKPAVPAALSQLQTPEVHTSPPPAQSRTSTTVKQRGPNVSTHGNKSPAVGTLNQGPGSIAQVGGSSNRAEITNNFGPQLRFPRERINELAELLSAQHGTVTISVRNPDSTAEEDASNLLTAFAKANWNTSGVNQEIHGTDIGPDGLPISDPVGIHIYAITLWLDRAMFVKEALKYFGVDSVLETDVKLSDGRLSIVVGRPKTSTKPETSRSR
jgi:hypothetical protein